MPYAEFIDSSFIHVILGGDRLARDRESFRLQMGTAHIVARLEVSGILDVVDVVSSRRRQGPMPRGDRAPVEIVWSHENAHEDRCDAAPSMEVV